MKVSTTMQVAVIEADLKLAIYKALVPHMGHSREPSPLLEEKVRQGNLGMKTGEEFYRWTARSIQVMNRTLRMWLIGVNRLEKSFAASRVEDGEPKDEGEEG